MHQESEGNVCTSSTAQCQSVKYPKMQQAVHAVHNYMCASYFYGNAGKGTALCTELWDWLCLYSVCVPASMSGGITASLTAVRQKTLTQIHLCKIGKLNLHGSKDH